MCIVAQVSDFSSLIALPSSCQDPDAYLGDREHTSVDRPLSVLLRWPGIHQNDHYGKPSLYACFKGHSNTQTCLFADVQDRKIVVVVFLISLAVRHVGKTAVRSQEYFAGCASPKEPGNEDAFAWTWLVVGHQSQSPPLQSPNMANTQCAWSERNWWYHDFRDLFSVNLAL